jgi:hypothetical protein
MLTRPHKTKRTENRSKTQSSGAENSKVRRHSQPPIKSTGLDSFPFAPGRQKEVIKKQNQARELLHYEQT